MFLWLRKTSLLEKLCHGILKLSPCLNYYWASVEHKDLASSKSGPNHELYNSKWCHNERTRKRSCTYYSGDILCLVSSHKRLQHLKRLKNDEKWFVEMGQQSTNLLCLISQGMHPKMITWQGWTSNLHLPNWDLPPVARILRTHQFFNLNFLIFLKKF